MSETGEKIESQGSLEFVDAHHHFLDTVENGFQSFLASLLPDSRYLPADYEADVVEPLERHGLRFVGSVHVECMPDDGVKEASWVNSFAEKGSSRVRAIVASTDLTSDSVEADLDALQASSPLVRGIRWILDYDGGPFDGKTATHVATTRHADGGTADLLRGHEDGEVLPAFERGYAMLERHKSHWTFDLQCAPSQLPQAARLVSRYPGVPVCIDHLGKPRTVLKDDGSVDVEELKLWRDGMHAMAAISHVYCKISMLGYAVPGWVGNEEREELVKKLVCETVELFGSHRCMVGLNWWKDGAISDSDGLSSLGPDPVQFVKKCQSFFAQHSRAEKQRMFCGTAREFYKF